VDTPPADVRLETTRRLTAEQLAAVRALVDEATEHDGVPPLSEHVMLHLRHGGDAATRHLLVRRTDGAEQAEQAEQAGQLVAYAHLDVTDAVEGASVELVVAPAQRRRGFGRAIVERALAEAGGRLRLWAHGDLPDAAAMAERLGFRRSRVLWQMRRSLFAPLPPVELPDAVTVRTFEPGRDEKAWLVVNARAFADHPEQGNWTMADLHRRTQESWFDPAGFFLAERDERLIGFHWTKVHGGKGVADHSHGDDDHHGHGHGHGHGHEPIGEVYVLGVDPTAHGLGLGRQLTLIGLRHLRSRGLTQVMLYVDDTNGPAIRLYESLGFSRWDTDVLFRRP
jgi:mycothiol synthase